MDDLRRRLASASLAALGALGGLSIACGLSRLPAPGWTPQPTSALAEVPYPPPPARVERVPPSPSDDAVWIDGEWSWQTRRYMWKTGRWVVPPANASFSPWTTVRDARGTLFLAAGTWRDAMGASVDEPAALALAVPAIGPIITPEGDRLPSGPVLVGDAGVFVEPERGEPSRRSPDTDTIAPSP